MMTSHVDCEYESENTIASLCEAFTFSDRLADRQAGRQTDRQTDTQACFTPVLPMCTRRDSAVCTVSGIQELP